jgi:hypothetical protein
VCCALRSRRWLSTTCIDPPPEGSEIKLRRLSRHGGKAEAWLEARQSRRGLSEQRVKLICGKGVPVLLLPCRRKSHVAIKTQAQQRQQRCINHKNSRDLAIVWDRRMPTQQQLPKREWAEGDFTKQDALTAVIQDHVNRVIRRVI